MNFNQRKVKKEVARKWIFVAKDREKPTPSPFNYGEKKTFHYPVKSLLKGRVPVLFLVSLFEFDYKFKTDLVISQLRK